MELQTPQPSTCLSHTRRQNRVLTMTKLELLVELKKKKMASIEKVKEREEKEEERNESPEARLGEQVGDLWDVQESKLTPTEKLNACFETIPVSAFPNAPSHQVIEIKSDTSLAETVRILAEHKILSAPVVNVDAPEDATWMDRYIGVVEIAGIAVWILHQSEPPSPRKPLSPGTASAATKFESGPESGDVTPGHFFETLGASDLYKNTEVREISGSFRWAPFLALQQSNSFLTMMLLLSKYKMKSIPVLDSTDGKVDNIITQAAVIHMLAECAGRQWFQPWGTKTLSQVGLPVMLPKTIVKVSEDDPVLHAFKLMRKLSIGGIPVVEGSTNKAVGNINLRDVQFLLTAPEIFRDYRSITAKVFVTEVRKKREKDQEGMITCTKNYTMKDMIEMLDSKKMNRVYVVDGAGNLEGVITLRDIISKIVDEPQGYFGDFFEGVLPLPITSI